MFEEAEAEINRLNAVLIRQAERIGRASCAE